MNHQDDAKKEQLRYLFYEFWMLAETHKRLLAEIGDIVIQNALIEAFCTHARGSTSASVIHIWRCLKENGPGIPWEGLFTEPLPKEEQAVDFLTLPLRTTMPEPMKRSPKSGGSGRHKRSFGGSLTHEVI